LADPSFAFDGGEDGEKQANSDMEDIDSQGHEDWRDKVKKHYDDKSKVMFLNEIAKSKKYEKNKKTKEEWK
jgi:hypothetical protein